MNEESTNVPSGQRMFSCPACNASHQVDEDPAREALRIVMSYPNIRATLGSQVSSIADAALLG